MTKIEVVRQQDFQDCGACSLLCIIKYYHGYVPLAKIRDDTMTNSLGTSAYHIVMAAQNYGFEAMGVKVDDIHSDKIYYPAIAHVILPNGLNHFVVVYKVTKSDVFLMDPAQGKVKMKLVDFLAIWDHVLILLNPISQIIKYDQSITIFTLFKKLIFQNKTIFLKVCLINTLLMIFTIICSFYFQIAISLIEKGQEFSFFKVIFLLFLWFSMTKVILTFFKQYFLTYFYKNLDACLLTDFLNHIFHLPLRFIQNRSTGEIISRVQDLTEVKEFLADFFTNVLLNSVLVVGSIIVLYALCANLFLILCLVISLYVVVGIITGKLIYGRVKKNIQSATEFNAVLIENLEMNTSIKNLNLVTRFLNRMENKTIIMLKSNFKTQQVLNYILLLKELIYELGLFLITSWGIYYIYIGKLNLLNLVTFNSLLLYLFNPIQDFLNLLPKYYYLKATFQKITEFINVKLEDNQKGFQKVASSEIEFLDVSYSYNQVQNVLEHVTFKIEEGDKVLITGPSGSGKSTICNSISQPYVVKNGIIKLGGVNVADYSLSAIQNTILYVGQNERLFTGTILENITCFRNLQENDYLEVIKICELENMFSKRPNRFHTKINASINNLSGGERQRIILARALLKKAKILILDEALSEVDLELEKRIIVAIKNKFKDITLLYVSHKNVQSQFSKIIDLGDFNG